MSVSCRFSVEFVVGYVYCMVLVVADMRTKPHIILSWNVPNSNDETKNWLFNACLKVWRD